MRKPKVVHHFTSIQWLYFIKRQGIYRGKCPMTSSLVLDHPNFTTDPNPENQGWAVGSIQNKRAVRIAVSVRHCDQNWFRWVDMAREHGASASFIQSLNLRGGGGKNNWWIHKGTIFPSDFFSIEMIGEPTPFELNALKHAEEWGSKSYDDFLRKEIEEGYTRMVLDTRIRNSKRMIAVPTAKTLEEVLGTSSDGSIPMA